MNLLNYKDVEMYLQNKEVYFKKGIVNGDFKTVAECDRVYNVGKVELARISDNRLALTIEINGSETTMYEYKSDLELFAWVKVNFIPVSELVKVYHA